MIKGFTHFVPLLFVMVLCINIAAMVISFGQYSDNSIKQLALSAQGKVLVITAPPFDDRDSTKKRMRKCFEAYNQTEVLTDAAAHIYFKCINED